MGDPNHEAWCQCERCSRPRKGGLTHDREKQNDAGVKAKSKECEHRWRAFTRHKVECSRCGKRVLWSGLLKEAEADRVRAIRLLRDLNPRARFGMNPTFSAIAAAHEYLNEVDRRRQPG